jgi:hypothetical protein
MFITASFLQVGVVGSTALFRDEIKADDDDFPSTGR